MTPFSPPSLSDFERAQNSLSRYLRPTPLVFSHWLTKELEREVYLKLETQQPTGAFKVRCAFFGILSQLEEAQKRGVLTTSSGNFAQAVAYAAKLLGVKATIVMTDDTHPYKVARTQAHGAEVVFCGLTFESRFETVARLEAQTGAVVLHGFDSFETITGNGTLGLELNDQMPAGDFDLLCPVSGGGLLSGITLALKACAPMRGGARIGVQPEAGGAMARSIQKGEPVCLGKIHTVADALVASTPGVNTFGILRQEATGWILIQEDKITEAVGLLEREQKLVVEPGGAVGVAAILFHREALPHSNSPLVVILSGGNR